WRLGTGDVGAAMIEVTSGGDSSGSGQKQTLRAKNEMRSYRNGQTDSCSALRGGDGSRYSRCRFRVLQKPILGTADSEYWHCLGVRSFLLEIPHASMIARHKADITTAFRDVCFWGNSGHRTMPAYDPDRTWRF